MEDILISSPLFDPEKSKQYYLSIQLGLDGFSFCVLDAVSNKMVYLNHLPGVMPAHLKDFVPEHEILSLPFARTEVMVCDNKVTASPSSLCNASNSAQIYKLSHASDDMDIILSDKQPQSGITHIYSLPADLHKTLLTLFSNVTIRHHQAVMSWKALNFFPSLHAERVFLTIWNKSFHMLVVKGEQIAFMNQFEYQTIDDFLYFFLYTFKKMDLDPETSQVIVHGKIFKQSILIVNLRKYIRKLEFSNWPDNLNYSNGILELPGHYFSNLCILHLCES